METTKTQQRIPVVTNGMPIPVVTNGMPIHSLDYI